MLIADNLTVYINDRFLIKDVSFQIIQGDIYGLIGPNGAGKTTLIKALLGLVGLYSGSIRIGSSITADRSALVQIGALIERAPIYNHLSAYDNLRIAAVQFGMDKSRIDEVLEIVGLADEHKKLAKKLSMGMKQRLGIGLAILHKPAILILDEPTNGLDPDGILEIEQLLLSINRTLGITMLIASHHLNELEKVVTHIGLLKNGVLIFNDSLDAFKQANSLKEAYNKYDK